MSTEDNLDREHAATERHLAAAEKVAAACVGWKVDSKYVAKRGSVYVTFVSCCEKQYMTKLRIADHEATSESHAACDITLLVAADGSCDAEGVAAAIIAMEDGGTY